MALETQEFRDAGVARWIVSHRSRHRRGGGSDLSDHLVPVREHRSCLALVCAGAARLRSTPASAIPPRTRLKRGLPRLEGGAGALAVASGQTASAFAIFNLAQAGDNIVSSTDLYGGTWTLLSQTLKQFGIEVRFVDPADPENFRRATDAKTRAYFGETLPNPKLNVFPIKEVADIGRSLGVPLILDNTASPLIARPFEHGAAVVVYSTTKYIGGHGTAIGGAIVDGGNFDWAAHAERFPLLNKPDEAYHGAIWTEAAKPLGPIAYILRARRQAATDLGASIAPQNAFQFIQGLETLPLRIRQQQRKCRQGRELPRQARLGVERASSPACRPVENRRRADALSEGRLRRARRVRAEGRASRPAAAFIDALKLFYHVANIGDVRSLAIHPASTTHQQLTADEQLAAGVTPGYCPPLRRHRASRRHSAPISARHSPRPRGWRRRSQSRLKQIISTDTGFEIMKIFRRAAQAAGFLLALHCRCRRRPAAEDRRPAPARLAQLASFAAKLAKEKRAGRQDRRAVGLGGVERGREQRRRRCQSVPARDLSRAPE